MKALIRCALCTCLLAGSGGWLAAQESAGAAGQAEDKTPTSYDMKAQAALDLQQMQQKFVSLAQAIPQEKYNWRPDAESRSIAEMFLHTAGAGFGFPKMLDVAAPADFTGKGFDKTTTDKAKIVEWLNKSFAHQIAAANGITNADYAKLVPKLGPGANQGDVIYLLVVHQHEQLGIAIAYARSVGVTPPWTADALKKAKGK
ncbi:MAG: DinB family protein [Acidobacteria bacterium]|nr:DinB family protein [Acidobacteriota bacterium]MBS1864574.1 DinB family protein [Acidobacteriota bacterium]